MTKKERELVRMVYQNIPTQAEKDLFLSTAALPKAQKAVYLASAALNLSEEQKNAFLGIVSLTPEDRAVITAAVARGLINRFLAWLFGKR